MAEERNYIIRVRNNHEQCIQLVVRDNQLGVVSNKGMELLIIHPLVVEDFAAEYVSGETKQMDLPLQAVD